MIIGSIQSPLGKTNKGIFSDLLGVGFRGCPNDFLVILNQFFG